jgi:DNA-binding response OmpR family regulator
MFRKILLVEDNNAIAENIVNFLKLDHKNVDVASDGLLGRDMFIKDPQKYDLIILDLMLPKVDGQELCKRI